MFHLPAKVLSFTTVLAASCLLGVSTAPAATDPGDQCAAGVAKAMATCTKKAVGYYAGCYKTTGEACASNNEKLTAASQKAASYVRGKCSTLPAIEAAGYGSYTVNNLGNHFGDGCLWQAKAVAERAFGTDGSKFEAADDDGEKCLLAAAKEGGKFLGGTLGVISKCAADGCSFDFSTGDVAENADKAAAKITKKCPDLNALIGQTVDGFLDSVAAQVPSAVASPCDPMDTTRCAFPFPNDQFSIPAPTPSGRQLAMGRAALPTNAPPINKPVATAKFNAHDGFSIGPMLLMNDTAIDLTVTGAPPLTDLAQSLESDSPVVLIDALTGEQQLIWVERDLRGATIADRPIIIRVARNLKEGRRYIVAMRNMKNTAGTTLSASAAFALYRDNTPTTVLPVEARRAHMEEIFTALTSAGITRNNLYLAWDFTTQSSDSAAGTMLAMRDTAFDILGTAAPSFTVDTVTANPTADSFRRVDGTFQVPLFLTEGGDPGSELIYDNSGAPIPQAPFTASFRCTIPNSATTGGAAPAIPARISMYGHGLLGSHTEVTAGNVRAMSNEHNVIFCATDWTGFAEDDALYVLSVLKDFSLFPNFIDRQHQGILNFMFLSRLMTHAAGFASNAAFQVGGQSMIDNSDIFYDGNSQGGILGGVLAAFEQDATRFSLGVPGMNYSTLLNRSTDFTEFDELLTDNYALSTDRNLLLSVAQITWDRTDPNGHINHVTSDPYEGTPAKTILYQVAFGDHQVAPVTAENAARSNGAHIHTPVLSPGKVVPDVTPYYDIPAIPSYPYAGSALVIWDSGNPAPPVGNIPPEEITSMDAEWAALANCARNGTGGDPHGCPRSDPDARIQKSEFLKTTGAVVDVCGGAPCFAQ